MNEIKLRAIEPEDLELTYEIENNKELWNVGITNVPYSRFSIRQYIANTQNDIYADKQLRLMIENAEGTVVGIADLANYDPRHNRAEVGIVIIDKWRRRGIATKALEAVKNYASRIIHLHKLYAIISEDNTIAEKLFNTAGFTQESMLKDWLYDGSEYKDALLMSYICEQ
ncbi:MAG: GNAT family N-acetyltransferase [Prevotella sp.]|nr:GNAT family N-acetyltransferase [Prevotella sp.]